MANILVIGAGRSTASLIQYLLKHAPQQKWNLTIADMSLELAQDKVAANPLAKAVRLDVQNETQRRELISANDMVVSMLPAFMHGDVARDCVDLGKHMFTASYVSAEMRELDDAAKRKGIILMNEVGLDPGIDHASAMKLIDELHAKGAVISSFKSYCGGLVAPESNDNPWGYKFSWNPRNVLLAGQSTAQYLEDGKLKFIPYNRLFTQTDTIEVDGYGKFDAYANRDSISYQRAYGLEKIQTLLRGTLRMPGYCKAWNVFVRLGLTDDNFKIEHTEKLTYTDLLEAFVPEGKGDLRQRLRDFMGNDYDADVESKLNYLELFTHLPIRLTCGSPAQLLQDLLEQKWKLKSGDKDMIVMQHLFTYKLNGKTHHLTSSLVVKGYDEHHTAMAKTVGLPLAITLKNFLNGRFQLSGVQIPVKKEIYLPLLAELEQEGICFTEKEMSN